MVGGAALAAPLRGAGRRGRGGDWTLWAAKALNLVLKILKKPPKGPNLRFFATGQANRFDAVEAREHGLDRDLSFKPATDVRSP